MSDRPTGTNGKRNQWWGSTSTCPSCGQCLCFLCHPNGPCLDEHHPAGSQDSSAECYYLWPTGTSFGQQPHGRFPEE